MAVVIVIGFRGMQYVRRGCRSSPSARPRADAAFLDHFIRLIVPDTDFGGAGDQLVLVMTYSVPGAGRYGQGYRRRSARRTSRCLPVRPTAHMHGVKVKEGAQIPSPYRGCSAVRRYPTGAYGADNVHPACQ